MALSRNFLKALGLTEEQVNSIVEAHTETISGLKDELKIAKEKADRLGGVEKELNDLKTANAGKQDYETLYNEEHKAFEAYKSDITAKQARAAKEAAIGAFFEKNNIVGKQKKIAMMAIKGDIDGYEVDEAGNLKDTQPLETLIKEDFAGLVSTQRTEGANTAEPPSNIGGDAFDKLPLYEKMKFANEHPNDASVKAFLGK
jgi:hypothetical protein